MEAKKKDTLGEAHGYEEPMDKGTGYGDVITPGADQKPPYVKPPDMKIVNARGEVAGTDAGGEGGTSGTHGGDAAHTDPNGTELPLTKEEAVEKPRPIP